ISGEIVFEKLVGRLMTLAVEYAGAGRGLLITTAGGDLRVEAEAVATPRETVVNLRQKPISGAEVAESILHCVVRTQDSVVLQDAAEPSPFSADPYIRQAHVRSVLCLPLLKQKRLVAGLYLENKLTSHVFTAERSEVLPLVGSQAAISLDHAPLSSELQRARPYLTEAQQLSHTGSLGWRPSTGELIWSSETYQIFGLDPREKATIERAVERVHPDDRARVEELLARVARAPESWQIEHRLQFPDGSIKHLHVFSRPVERASDFEYVGAIMDVTARKAAERQIEEKEVLHLANERLALALRGSNVGVWDFDLRGTAAIESAPMYSINMRERLGYEIGSN